MWQNKQHWFPFVWFCFFRTIWLYLKCFKCNCNIVFHVINLLTTVQGINCFKYTSKLAESLDAYLDIFLIQSLFGYCILTCWTILYLIWKLVVREWYSKAVVTMSVTCCFVHKIIPVMTPSRDWSLAVPTSSGIVLAAGYILIGAILMCFT